MSINDARLRSASRVPFRVRSPGGNEWRRSRGWYGNVRPRSISCLFMGLPYERFRAGPILYDIPSAMALREDIIDDA